GYARAKCLQPTMECGRTRTRTLIRRFAPPSPGGRREQPYQIPLPPGEGAPQGRVRVRTREVSATHHGLQRTTECSLTRTRTLIRRFAQKKGRRFTPLLPEGEGNSHTKSLSLRERVPRRGG